MRRTMPFASAVVPLVLLAAAPAALAQVDFRQWTAPVAVRTELAFPGEGTADGNTLRLPLSRQVELHVRAFDQNGNRFPQQKLRFEFEFERDCGGLVRLVGASDDGVTLETGRGAGSCQVLLWIPGNLNLDRRLRVEVGAAQAALPGAAPPTGAADAAGTREGLIAAALFRGILGREPDRQWVNTAAEQMRRGGTQTQIRAMLASPEFSQRRQTRSPEELLDDLYVGLLGRKPDAQGFNTYVGDVRRGNFEKVILAILGSSEFNQRISGGVG